MNTHFLSKRPLQAILLVAAALLLAIVPIFLAQNSPPGIIEIQDDETQIYFAVERALVIFPGDCVRVNWRVNNITAVLYNDEPAVGEDSATTCLDKHTTPTLEVHLRDGTTRFYFLPVKILVTHVEGWVLLALPPLLLLLAIWRATGVRYAGIEQRIRRLSPRISTRTVLLLISLLFSLWSIRFILTSSYVAPDGTRYYALFDDAMISMRYALNLSQGDGLVWNEGERVEGYTNLLMTLYMALMHLLFEKRLAVLSIQISGIFIILACASLSMKIARFLPSADSDDKTFPRGTLRLVAFTAPMLYYPLVYWTLMGMETGLLTLLLLLSIYLVLEYTHTGQRVWLIRLTVTLGLAYLTRPDALLPVGLILGYLFYSLRGRCTLRQSLRIIATIGAGVGLFVAGQTLFRLIYYGQTLPNTYILKVAGISSLDRLSNGVLFIGPFLLSISAVLFGVVWGLWHDTRPVKLLLAGLMAILIVYQIYVGGDAWFYWRITAPGMPLLLLLFIYEMLRHVRIQPNNIRWALHWLTYSLVLISAWFFINYGFLGEITFARSPYQTHANAGMISTALALDEVLTPEGSIGVIWAGTIPYYTERLAIDFLGKSDPQIARAAPRLSSEESWNGMNFRPGHNRYNLYYSIQERQPDYIQNCRWDSQSLCSWTDEHYANAVYEAVSMRLRRDSDHVYWDKVDVAD
jgi:hypothetical protein